MALNDTAMQSAATHLQSILLYMQAHNGDPGTGGTNNLTSAAREAISWGTPTSNGDFDIDTPIVFTGIAANDDVTYMSLWSALAGGTHYGNFATAGDVVANSNGDYTINSFPINGSAS